MCVYVGGGSKAKALQACSVLLVLLLRDGILPCEQEVSDQKKTLNQVGYIILLKRVCRLDQNTVTMALRRVFYSLSLSTFINRLEYCAC